MISRDGRAELKESIVGADTITMTTRPVAIWFVDHGRARWFCTVARSEALLIAVRLREVCQLAPVIVPFDWDPEAAS